MKSRTSDLKKNKANVGYARRKWNSAQNERRGVHECLATMALGIERCMYCGDNLGTDIDHFEPISRAPLRTFDWLNHLLACSFCNSNQKRGLYPCDLAGDGLLIDPTREDPSQHIRLILSTGEYRELSEKGLATIQVFGLNRADLVRGRLNAFNTRQAVLCRAHDLFAQGRDGEAARCLKSLAEEPHASVLHAMVISKELPGALEVLGDEVIAALENPEIQRLVHI